MSDSSPATKRATKVEMLEGLVHYKMERIVT
jgi:hypothetical protein